MERSIKWLIWLYLILLIFEGSLRKWIMPSYADQLLVVRDPVVLMIYLLAVISGRFEWNGFVIATLALAAASVAASIFAGQDNFIVTAYGIRINYLHVPLIWVIAKVLTREDVERIGSFLLLIAIPMTLLMVMQFKSPAEAPINRGVGSEEGGQIFGADGRIRPPGFFSFITGPQMFFPLVAAFFFNQISSRRRLIFPILLGCGLAILIALPISISRTVMLATVIVGLMFCVCLPFSGAGGLPIMRAVIFTGIVGVAVSFLPVFSEGREVFMMRWETAAVKSDGDAWEDISGRVMTGFTQPFAWAARAPFFGNGIGVGSNVGARLISGRVGFLLAEDEWGKVFLELGPVLGGAFILLRISIALRLGLGALSALFSRRDNLPALLFSACAIPIVQNQWAPPTILGFAVFGGGLTLAALKEPVPDEEKEEEEDEESDATDKELEEAEIDPDAPQTAGELLGETETPTADEVPQDEPPRRIHRPLHR